MKQIKQVTSQEYFVELMRRDGVRKITHDVNGNPRYIMHFTCFLTDEEETDGGYNLRAAKESGMFQKAKERANRMGWRVYTSKKWAGYFVGTSYDIKGTLSFLYSILNE